VNKRLNTAAGNGQGVDQLGRDRRLSLSGNCAVRLGRSASAQLASSTGTSGEAISR
jgi:hypothetical protein